MYQWVLEVYFRMGRKKGLHSANPTRIRLLDELKSRVSPPSFKDNSKGHIRTKYTGMTCNGVGVILPRRWWTLGSCKCAKQEMCRWSVYFILIVLLIEIIMIWTTPVMFLRNLSIFCLRRATFFLLLWCKR